MSSSDTQPVPFEARLEALQAQLLALGERVRVLEQRGTIPQPWSAPPPPVVLPSPAYPPSQPYAAAPAVRVDEPIDEPASNPGRVLALIGGVALLLGLIGFVAYAIEQAWLPPLVRFFGAAIISAALTLAAWPLARRGHAAVAGAVGGAGLGAWFASWLFARHAHELVSGPQLVIALVLGAGAGLLIADRLRLRSMAVLASLAACATPVLVSMGNERLAELMGYQLAVVGVLAVIDARRRWPELPTIALASTWLLGGRWAAVHLGPDNAWVFMVWALVILLASVGSAWRLLVAELDSGEREHVLLRLLLGGVACWAAAAAAFWHLPHTLALLSLGLAAWHVGVAWMLERESPARGSGRFVALAWAQIGLAGPLAVDGAALAWWWIGMSVVAAVLPWSPLVRMRRGLLLIPAAAAVAWSLELPQPVLMLALLAASVPLVASLLASDEVGERRVDVALAIAAVLLWTTAVHVAGPVELVAKLAWCLVPLVVLIARACVGPDRHAVQVSLAAIGVAGLELGTAIVDGRALQASGSPGLASSLALVSLALAGLVFALLWRTSHARALEQLDGDDEVVPLGLALAGALGGAACLIVAALNAGGAGERVGFTICIALMGLGLLIAGLRAQQSHWRQAGLAAIGVAGCKVVLFDLAAADPIWRALAFVGIGAVLIAGALAYSRAQQRLAQS